MQASTRTGEGLVEFTNAYINTALRSNFDAHYGADDVESKTRWDMERDCINFLTHVEVVNKSAHAELFSNMSDAGRDFWLARNGRGVGFWGDWEHGYVLSEAAKTFGSMDLYVGDDGKIYG